MRLPVEYYIALKYLLAKRKQTFISIITIISVAGVTVGVMALIIVLAVMSGFEKELKDRILGATAHVHVTSLDGSIADPFSVAGRVRRISGVEGASPYIFSQMMISSGVAASGGVLRGVDVATIGEVTRLPKDITQGSIDALRKKDPAGLPGILLGKELAGNLGVSLGDVVEILVPGGNVTPLGTFPRVTRFRVGGISESGMYEYDSTFAYVSFPEAGKLLGMDERGTGIEVKVADVYAAGKVAARIRSTLGPPYWAKDWMQSNRNLFSALRLEKAVMFIILVLIVMVAAFNIISTLIMIVMEKTRDIAVLMTMGATRKTILRVFALAGVLIGVVGTGLGTALGMILCDLLRRYQFIRLPSDVYYISTLPVLLDPANILLVSGSSILICFLATLYPSVQAARIDPAEAIRYE
ncbi:MAG TPA: lipoprotein-releasing ABC transporter permease subunit [Candidatus Limnocylindrales bacterium]|nr:lipoprotein-releasing ABC transporter permease subunit [Candidatus Limnocylindrales bacterium]